MVDKTLNVIRNLTSDRVIKLKPREGEKPLNSKGMVDTRLFSGDNNIHVKMDKQSSLWYFEYDNGVLPQQLQQRFTSYSKALDFAKQYYDRRNVDVKEVVDA
jgi:hypothetical protein